MRLTEARVTPSGARILPDPDAFANFQTQAMGQYGIHSNAEEMIVAHRQQVSPAVQKASLIQIDPEATLEAKKDLDGCAKKLGLDKDGPAQLVDVCVRGNALIGIIEYPETGMTRKVVAGWTDDYVGPRLTPDELAQQQSVDASVKQQQEIERLRAEFQAELADKAAELGAEMASEIEKIRESATREIEKVREAAVKEDAKEDRTAARASSRKTRSARRARKTGGVRKTGSARKTQGSDGGSLADTADSPEVKANQTAGTTVVDGD